MSMTASPKKSVMVHCPDERYSVGAREELPPAYDFTCLGGSLWFVENARWREGFFEQVRVLRQKLVAKKAIDIDTVIVADHYSPSGHHGCLAHDPDDSYERHVRNLRRAADLIAAEPGFEGLAVRLLLHDIDGGNVQEVEIAITELAAA